MSDLDDYGACGSKRRPHDWTVSYGGVQCRTCNAYITARAFADFERTCSALGEGVFDAAMKASRKKKEGS